MIAIVDYGMGNLRSVEKAFERLGHAACVTRDGARIGAADGLIIPGVGAFPAAMEALTASGCADAVRAFAASGRPVLGICLGHQLLLDEGTEVRPCAGLGIIPGRVERFVGRTKVPHMGWNCLTYKPDPLFAGIEQGAAMYFVHTFYTAVADGYVLATCDYEGIFPAAIKRGNTYGVQFHPEKSGDIGLRLLDNFAGLTEGRAQ